MFSLPMYLIVYTQHSYGEVAYFLCAYIKNTYMGDGIMTRTVLVTGSSRGLGATIVKTLAQQGFQVVINYHQSEDAAKELVTEIGDNKAIAIQADVTNRQEVDHMIETRSEERRVGKENKKRGTAGSQDNS